MDSRNSTPKSWPSAYRNLKPFYGDIHNHCGISYGHGSIENALENARLQLDFTSVTGHAHWHDMPSERDETRYFRDYHQKGFDKLKSMWAHVKSVTNTFNKNGRFATFLSFEWHSSREGDYCVYFKDSKGEIIRAETIEELRGALRQYRESGTDVMMIPHHIGYPRGYRGLNWDSFTSEFSPVVELVSMHGCSEYDLAPRPFLHTMGPRDSGSSLHMGLRKRHIVGVIGSTDHHSAHPGSYGYGMTGVWADELSRESIWEAIQSRRVYALTGDKIDLAVELNGHPMGAVIAPVEERKFNMRVVGGCAIDYVELVRNGDPIFRKSAHEIFASETDDKFVGIIALRVGWGEPGTVLSWDIDFGVNNGSIIRYKPRFRGEDIVAPKDEEPDLYQFSKWEKKGKNCVCFTTQTRGNPNVRTDGTQQFALEIEGNAETEVFAVINGRKKTFSVAELRQGARSGFVGEFAMRGAYCFEMAIPRERYDWSIRYVDKKIDCETDYYYVRIRQLNDQWAWSSPFWVGNDQTS